jgi:hypothetical protein
MPRAGQILVSIDAVPGAGQIIVGNDVSDSQCCKGLSKGNGIV